MLTDNQLSDLVAQALRVCKAGGVTGAASGAVEPVLTYLIAHVDVDSKHNQRSEA